MDTQEGGAEIVVQLEYAKNGTARFMGEYDLLDTRPMNVLTAANFNWTQLGGTAIVTDKEKALNNGKFAIGRLAKAKIGNLVHSLQDAFNASLFANASYDATQPQSLDTLIAASGTVGGIDRSVNTFWQANVDSTSTTLSALDMTHMFNTCTHNRYTPDLLITTQTLFEKYEGLLVGKLAIPGPSTNDLGFQTLNFKGASLYWDGQCPAGFVYFANSQFIKVVSQTDNDFVMGEATRPANQLLTVYPATWFGNVICSNPRAQGKMVNRS